MGIMNCGGEAMQLEGELGSRSVSDCPVTRQIRSYRICAGVEHNRVETIVNDF